MSAEVIEREKKELLEAIQVFTDAVDDKDGAYETLKPKLTALKANERLTDKEKAFTDITESGKEFNKEERAKLRELLGMSAELTLEPAAVVNSGEAAVVKSDEDLPDLDLSQAKKDAQTKAAAAAKLEEEAAANLEVTKNATSFSEIGTGPNAPITAESSAQTALTTSAAVIATPTVAPPPKDKKAAAAALVTAATELQSLINVVAAASAAAAKGRASGTSGDLSSLMARIAALEKQNQNLQASTDATKLTEDEAAIRAIMTGEDALAHKIKFLVDIPKWQQFKMIGEDGNSFEETSRNLGRDMQFVSLAETNALLVEEYAELKTVEDLIEAFPKDNLTKEQLGEQQKQYQRLTTVLGKMVKSLEDKNKIEMNNAAADYLRLLKDKKEKYNKKSTDIASQLASGNNGGASGGSKAHKKTRHMRSGHMRSGYMRSMNGDKHILGRAKYSRKKHHMRGGVSAEDVLESLKGVDSLLSSDPVNPGAIPGANPVAKEPGAKEPGSDASTAANPGSDVSTAANPSPVASSTDPNSAASSSDQPIVPNPVVEEVKPVPEAKTADKPETVAGPETAAGPDIKAAETVAAEPAAGPDAKAAEPVTETVAGPADKPAEPVTETVAGPGDKPADKPAEPVTETVAGPGGGKRSSPKRSSPKRSSPKRSSPKRSSPKRSSPKRSSPKRSKKNKRSKKT